MAHLLKDEFISQLKERISSQTQCIAYTPPNLATSTAIPIEPIFISGWEPGWEYKGRANNGLIFSFSDQDEKRGDLRLRSVYLPQWNYIDYVDELYEHRCPE